MWEGSRLSGDGRPVATLSAIEDEAGLDTLRLAHDARFVELLETARQRVRVTGGVPLAEFRRLLEATRGEKLGKKAPGNNTFPGETITGLLGRIGGGTESCQLIRKAGRWVKLPTFRKSWQLYQDPQRLPTFVRESPTAMRYLALIGPLAWDTFPERDLASGWPMTPVPYAAFAAVCLIKIDQGLSTMGALRRYLVDHPALVWLCGFRLAPSRRTPWGFDADASLPTQRHLTRMLRTMPNELGQYLLDSSLGLIAAELAETGVCLGESISLDTKHIIAWVKENNHTAYVSDRYDKAKQPTGDPDCRLGCQRRHNQRAKPDDPPPTPHQEGRPARTIEYFHQAEGFAAVPFVERGGHKQRSFSPDGLPLCPAGLTTPALAPQVQVCP